MTGLSLKYLMRYFFLLLLISSSAFGEIIRINLSQEPCTPGCAENLKSKFETNAAFRSVHVLAKYRFIELNAMDWVQDDRLKEIVREQGYTVLSIKRTPN